MKKHIEALRKDEPIPFEPPARCAVRGGIMFGLFLLLLMVNLQIPAPTAQDTKFMASTVDVVGWNFTGVNDIPEENQAQLIRVISDLDPETVPNAIRRCSEHDGASVHSLALSRLCCR